MNIQFRLLTVLVLFLAPASQALAKGYVLFGLGNSQDDILNISATGFKIGVGANLHENIAVELAYVDLGTFDFALYNIEFRQYGLAAGVRPVFKVSEGISVYGKLGLYSWTFEVSNAFMLGVPAKDTGTDPFFGFGFEFKVGDKAAIVAEYETYDVSDGDVRLLSLGVKIEF